MASLMLGLSGAALAVDGVVEINDVAAVAGGVTPGDAPGYPVTLSRAGSYRLTSNLYSLDIGRTVLEVTADGVSIDLNGFEVAPCVSGAVCGNAGPEGYGVNAGSHTELVVRDGRIRGMKLLGILAGDSAHVESVRVVDNDGIGIEVGSGSRVIGNALVGNAPWGMFAGFGSVVTGNTAYQNGSGGTSGGIWAVASTVRGNSAYDNAGIGIKAASQSTVIENSASGNTGVGLELSTAAGHRDNVLGNNSGGNVTGGKALGTNVCDGVTCNSPPRRRYYLTTGMYDGAQADEAGTCADGFHFASLWEIWELSQLEYDTSLGNLTADSGSGPPVNWGWVRTGDNSGSGPNPGHANCLVWTNSTSNEEGTIVHLSSEWSSTTSPQSLPWTPLTKFCDNTARVWCVQD